MKMTPEEFAAAIEEMEKTINQIWSQVTDRTPEKIRSSVYDACQQLRDEHRKRVIRQMLTPEKPKDEGE